MTSKAAGLVVAVVWLHAATAAADQNADTKNIPTSLTVGGYIQPGFTVVENSQFNEDDELIEQISDFEHDPAEKLGSVALTQAWADKSYQMIYLTARPHMFRTETRQWLIDHGYAGGPIITAPQLVFSESARMYNREWVNRVKNQLGWDVVAAYGNAGSDIDAYEDAGIDKATTFIIGENAGVAGSRHRQ